MIGIKALEFLFLCEIFEQGLCCFAPHIALLENLEADTVVPAAESLHFVIGAGLLGAKLVAGEA